MTLLGTAFAAATDVVNSSYAVGRRSHIGQPGK